jgi:hypothetical protein
MNLLRPIRLQSCLTLDCCVIFERVAAIPSKGASGAMPVIFLMGGFAPSRPFGMF